MIYPTETDFLATFGIKPTDHDPEMGSYFYVLNCDDPRIDIHIFFSPVEHDFSVRIIYLSNELTSVFLSNTISVSIHAEKDVWYILVNFIYVKEKIESLRIDISPKPSIKMELFSPNSIY